MKALTALLLAILATILPANAADDLSYYDSSGQATAYADDDATIYLWGGTPAAYLAHSTLSDSFDIYGFNGKHLGWFEKGVVYDHDGRAVGAVRSAFTTITELEPLKGLKELKPIQAIKDILPVKPVFSTKWSRTPLKAFLLSGSAN